MHLSRKTLTSLDKPDSIPSEKIFGLPEKVIQFGTGVLLRGLPDYYIDKANKNGIFNGRIVMVKSTDGNDSDAYEKQDCLYTHCIKGVNNQELVEEYVVNASISRVLSAKQDWKKVLECAHNPELDVVISNTTEVGIVLLASDNIKAEPPISFPGKLLAFLYERYKAFSGDMNKGLVIVPTELITDNGEKLQSILTELAHINKFDYAFIDWLEHANHFCNTLVDRIVPGKLPASQHAEVEKRLGYKDELMIMSEVYGLWAIESSIPVVKKKLSFAKADEGVVITDDIDKHRELKLRLLNGTHSFSCGLAFLAGFETVKEAMQSDLMGVYVYDLMIHEIAPCLVENGMSRLEVVEFSNKVIDRFRNPFIDHRWINITMQYTHKMKTRNVPLLLKHYERDLYVPGNMALGFAAYLVFMKCEKGESGKYYGHANNDVYHVQDDEADQFSRLWNDSALSAFIRKVLSNVSLWGADLTALPGFTFAVEYYAESIMHHGALETLREYQVNRSRVESQEA